MTPFIVTISEKQLLDIDPSDIEEAKYIPDEWPEWHQELLNESEKAFNKLYTEFKELYPEENEDCTYTGSELEFMNKLYSIYQSVMLELRSEVPLCKVPFSIIYTSDCGRSFIYDSVVTLNSGIHQKNATEVYKED